MVYEGEGIVHLPETMFRRAWDKSGRKWTVSLVDIANLFNFFNRLIGRRILK